MKGVAMPDYMLETVQYTTNNRGDDIMYIDRL